ncbi:hypothetical protein, partial [Thiolapillus sp.]|uniref:hypothetical protein n=1 Tax=Thiolapillus sp. TaxID=2017437 RepID=UPI003AF54E40
MEILDEVAKRLLVMGGPIDQKTPCLSGKFVYFPICDNLPGPGSVTTPAGPVAVVTDAVPRFNL